MTTEEEYQKEILRLQQNGIKHAKELELLFRAQKAEALTYEKEKRIENLNRLIDKLITLIESRY